MAVRREQSLLAGKFLPMKILNAAIRPNCRIVLVLELRLVSIINKSAARAERDPIVEIPRSYLQVRRVRFGNGRLLRLPAERLCLLFLPLALWLTGTPERKVANVRLLAIARGRLRSLKGAFNFFPELFSSNLKPQMIVDLRTVDGFMTARAPAGSTA